MFNHLLRDQEEEEKRKNCVQDGKAKMREFLLHQISEKCLNGDIDKKSDLAQADVWNIENKNYFEKKNEVDEKVNYHL